MSRQMCRRDFLRLMAATGTGALAGCATGGAKQGRGARWYRGNLHMHTYWSDGRAFPEQAVSIYKQLGYDFIGLSDHNVFADQADCWRTVEDHPKGWPPQVGRPLFDAYSKAFGSEAETRTFEGETQVRLKTYGEMRSRFEEPGKFLLMPAVEITQYLKEEGVQVHMNYVNLPDVIPFVKGGPLSRPVDEPGVGVTELIRRDAGEVKALANRLTITLTIKPPTLNCGSLSEPEIGRLRSISPFRFLSKETARLTGRLVASGLSTRSPKVNWSINKRFSAAN